jgi:hypothetical protein
MGSTHWQRLGDVLMKDSPRPADLAEAKGRANRVPKSLPGGQRATALNEAMRERNV